MKAKFDIGQSVYFSNVSYDVHTGKVSQSVIDGYSVNKIIIEKQNDEYIYSYLIDDGSESGLLKYETALFSTEGECQDYISRKLSSALDAIKQALS
jgi:hypothetical protein